MSGKRKPGARELGALVWPHLRVERGTLAGGTLLGLLAAALQVAQPWPLKWALDHLTGAHHGGRLPTWLDRVPAAGLWTLAGAYLAISLAAAWAAYGHAMSVNGLVNRGVYRLRTALFGTVLRQPLVFHESREVGELVTRVIYDTARLRRGLAGLALGILQPAVTFALLFAVLLRVNLPLGALFCSGGLLALAVMRIRGRRIARAARKQRKREGQLASLVADELSAIREVQTFGVRGSASMQRFARRNQKSLRKEEGVRRLALGLTLRTEALVVVTTAVAIWAGASAVRAGTLTPGDLMLFFSYALLLHRPLTAFSTQVARMGRTWACAERLQKIARLADAAGDRPGAVPAPPLAGALAFEDVSYKAPRRLRGGRKWMLDGVSFELPAGRRVAVVGASGAGKSTLLRMVLGLVEPDRGAVRLDGHDLRGLQAESVRRQVSVVFQESVFTRRSVRENLVLGLEPVSDEAVAAAVAAARLDAWVARLPEGYDTGIAKAGSLFSGGERQRLAVARAILRDGRVWLLDEPITGLDPDAARDLTEVLLGITRGRTTLWVTHDPALAARLDGVIELADGAVAFAGTPAEHEAWTAAGRPAAPGKEAACRP